MRYLTIILSFLLEASLLEDTVQCPGGEVIVIVARDRHATLLERVFVLAVTPSLGNLIPAVLPELCYDITDFHPGTKTPGT
jgi:hypothetical protein